MRVRNCIIYFLLIVCMAFIVNPGQVYSEQYEYNYDQAGRINYIKTGNQFILHEYDSSGNLVNRFTSQFLNSEVNLIANSEFLHNLNGGDLADGWIKENYGVGTPKYEHIVIEGIPTQRISSSNIDMNGYSAAYSLIDVVENQSFMVSGRFNIASLKNAKVQLYVDFLGDQGYTGAYVTEYDEITHGEFITLNNAGIIPKNTKKAKVYALIRSTANGANGVISISSLQFNYQTNGNLLYNGKFELAENNKNVSPGWNSWPTDVMSSGNVSLSNLKVGNRSVQKITGVDIRKHSAVGISQLVKVEPNKPFTVQGNFQIETLKNTRLQLYIDFLNSDSFVGASITEFNESNIGNISLSTSGIVPSNATRARVYILLRSSEDGGSGILSVDNLEFKYSSKLNRIYNSEYKLPIQDGVSESWDKFIWGVANNDYSVIASNQGRYQKVIGSGMQDNGVAGISQLLKVTPGSQYNASGQFNLLSLNNSKIQLYIDFYNEIGFVGADIKEYDQTTDGKYITLETSGIVPKNATKARVYALLRAKSGNGASGEFNVKSLSYSE